MRHFETHKHNQIEGFYSYNGFGEPVYLAKSFSELMKNVIIRHGYILVEVDETDDFKLHVNDILEWLGIDIKEVTTEHKEDFEGLFYEYKIWWNPTYEELTEFNVNVGLDEDEYIGNLFN